MAIYNRIPALLLGLLFLLLSPALMAQYSLQGKVVNVDGLPIYKATLSIGNIQTTTDSTGAFTFEDLPKARVAMKITAIGYENEFQSYTLSEASTKYVTIRMTTLDIPVSSLEDVIFTENRGRREAGTINIDVENAGIRPDPTGGVEGMLKILVGPSNELSSQYSVRGGNFDENLVYINGFEVYRPFLVSSSQQEGLSVINPDLVGRVDFSTGGFQAKFGDKMSSVLDITYKKPKKFGGSAMFSLLGMQGHIETASKNEKFYFMTGIRHKTNQYLLQAQPTQGQYNPSFLDAQMVAGYIFNDRSSVEVIANYSKNQFDFLPESSSSFFGFVNQAYKLQSVYQGSESDKFDAGFLGLNYTYRPNEHLTLRFLASGYTTNEKETYDLSQEYFLSAVETDLGKRVGDILYSLGTGRVISHARNYLTAEIINLAHRGSYATNTHFWQWGLELQSVNIHDKLKEWEYRDSAAYSQPHDPNAATMYTVYNAVNELDYTRISAYVQDNIVLDDRGSMTLNLGLRANYSFLNDELLISPRAQFSIKPDWKKNVVFKMATGLYAQPPFYREMRDFHGPLNEMLKAQKSYHAAAGFDYNFTAWGDRPFKLTGEVFYKYLWDLVPYEFDNVRIRYYPNQQAIGYAYGGEIRLFGDLVKDAESWISLGYLNTKNKIMQSDGTYSEYLPRPTDRRVSFGVYFSDYLPRNKNFKVFMNMMYATGLPFNVPSKITESQYQIRIPDYKRVDIGFATLLLDGKRANKPAYSMLSYFQDIWLSVEVFNLLGNLNTIGYQWIQPADSDNIFLVPNRLTNRLINVKLALRF